MSVSPAFAPQEPPQLIRIEHGFFIEIAFEGIFYGMNVILFFLTARNLLLKKGIKSCWKLLGFLSVQQVAVLIGVFGNIHLAVLAFVYNRNFPGGPAAFQNAFSNLPIPFAALAGFTISTWLQDILLLYRFIIIWHGNYILFIFPFLVFLASVAFSLVLLVQTGGHAELIATAHAIPTPTIFFSLSIGLNIILTSLIVGRLLWYRHNSKKTLGSQHSSHYVSISAMIIESAALYTLVGIAQIASLQLDPAVAVAIEGMYGPMTALAPVLIAYRVSTDQAWTRETTYGSSSMKFAEPRHRFTSRNPDSTAVESRDDILLKTKTRGSQSRIGDDEDINKNTLV